MTHNTREIDQRLWSNILDVVHPHFRVLNEGTPNELTMGILELLHQELQKAHHNWLREEIVKLEVMKHVAQDKDGLLFSETNYNQALQTIIDRYQSELDPLNK